jgi:hypothetical protein
VRPFDAPLIDDEGKAPEACTTVPTTLEKVKEVLVDLNRRLQPTSTATAT